MVFNFFFFWRVLRWLQSGHSLWGTTTRTGIFVGDESRVQVVKRASPRTQPGARACGVWVTCPLCVSLCVCVCVCHKVVCGCLSGILALCVSVCLRAVPAVCVCNTSSVGVWVCVLRHTCCFLLPPASVPVGAVLSCFSFPLPSSPETNRLLRLSSLSSSFRSRSGGSGGWRCTGMPDPSQRPSSCFISLSNRSLSLSLCLEHKQPPSPLPSLLAVCCNIHVGWEQRQGLGALGCLLPIACEEKPCRRTQHGAAPNVCSQVLTWVQLVRLWSPPLPQPMQGGPWLWSLADLHTAQGRPRLPSPKRCALCAQGLWCGGSCGVPTSALGSGSMSRGCPSGVLRGCKSLHGL